MFVKTAVVFLLVALASSGMARPQADIEAILDLPREEAVARLKELLRPSLEAAIANAGVPTPYGVIDNTIIAALENARTMMKEGNPELGIPILDPFRFSHLHLETHQTLVDFTGDLDDFSIEGLAGFSIDQIKWSTLLFQLTLKLTWPKVEVKGIYGTDAVLGGLLPIYGDGPFDVIVEDFVVSGKVKISIKGLGFEIKSSDIHIDIGSFHVDIEGLLGGGDLSDLINEVINDLVPEVWVARKEQIETLLNEAIVIIGNQVLSGGKYSDVIEYLKTVESN